MQFALWLVLNLAFHGGQSYERVGVYGSMAECTDAGEEMIAQHGTGSGYACFEEPYLFTPVDKVLM